MKLLKRKRNMDHVTNFIPSPCKMSIVYTQKNIRMFIKFHCKNAMFTTPKVNTSTFITHHLDLIGHGSTIKMQLEHNARRCLQWKKSQPRRKSHYVVNLVLNTVAAAASWKSVYAFWQLVYYVFRRHYSIYDVPVRMIFSATGHH